MTKSNIKAVLTVLALVLVGQIAQAATPTCKKTVTTETRADGATVIRVHTVCTVK